MIRSRLYQCSVMHHRFAPRVHRFDYRIFMLALDLDELAEVQRSFRLLSVNRGNLFSFREADFMRVDEPVHNPTADGVATKVTAASSLKARVLAGLKARGMDLPDARVELVTMPRILGYQFNPVSFYFCYDPAGRPRAAVAEVTNTFREMKVYILDESTWAAGAFRLRVPKEFYVSPFSDLDVAFDFTLKPAGDRLAVQIDDYNGALRTLTSTLTGEADPLSDRRLAWFFLKYPLLTLLVVARIHWHALRLYLKGVPWFGKAARTEHQRNLIRPHSSLTTAKPSDA
jgi:DUF1365 family protein